MKAIKAKHQKALNDKKKAEEAAAGNGEAKEGDEIKEEGEEEKVPEGK